MRILVNLPPSFFTHQDTAGIWARLEQIGEVRKRSHNAADEIRADLAWADAVLMWSWPALTDDLLDPALNLRYIGQIDATQRGAGAPLARKMPVSIARHGFSPAVAEMALALILNTLRRVSDYHAAMRIGTEAWVKNFPGDIDVRERELTGRRVGLVGFGRVGQRLARLLQPFDCALRVVDPFISEQVCAMAGASRVGLDEMLRESDIVVLCAAANSGTAHLLGQNEIALLRPNAILVNVARAALIDTPALVERLQNGALFAALDVFDKEPLEADSALRTLPNAYLTPHRAGGIIASVQRILSDLIDDLEAEIAGRPRRYPLTEAMLPGLDA